MKKVLLGSFILSALWINNVWGQNFIKNLKNSEDLPTEFSADSVVYDDKNKKIIAIGNVEVIHEGAILVADRLEYDMVKDIIIAKDNVVISYSDGKTVFSKELEVSSDFKKGIAENIVIKNSDGSSLKAKDLVAKENNKVIMRDAFYTPCDLCEDKNPSWKLRASKIIYDQTDTSASYQNASLNIFGLPVMYLPYFAHGDMRQESKTGFLTPKFGTSGNLGAKLSFPFFIHLNDHHKLTLTPTYLSKENPLYSADYRGYTKHSKINLSGSYIREKDKDERYFFNSKTETHITENFRFRTDLNAISDETFLKVYDFSNKDDPWLMDEIALDGFWHNANLNISYYYFKDLRSYVDNTTMPKVFPAVDFNYVSEPSSFGGYYNVRFNSAFIMRDKLKNRSDEKYQRYSLLTDYNIPLKGNFGEVYKVKASLRGDMYNLEDTTMENGDLYSGIRGRIIPEVSLSSSYPLARTDSISTQIVEPVVVFAASPNFKEDRHLPNEDSRDFELTESNILSTNHFSGFDKVETGTRVNYGINYNIYGHSGYSFTTFWGQSYRITDSDYFPENSGIGEGFSDYIGIIKFYGNPLFDLDYSFRVDKDDFKINRSELTVGLGNTFLKGNINYLYIRDNADEYDDVDRREEIYFRLNSFLTRYVRISAWNKFNLVTEKMIEGGAGISYEDECLGLSLNFKRDMTKDRDYDGDTTVVLTLNLKTLGELRTGSLAVQ